MSVVGGDGVLVLLGPGLGLGLADPDLKLGLQGLGQVDAQLLGLAQQARRVLDRLVGYNLSPLLWRKVRGRLSAGRVQSVALRLIVDREREIDAFNPVEYWTRALQALEFSDIMQGMTKPLFFGFILSTVGCYYGLTVRGGTQGVGRATTQAVVASSVFAQASSTGGFVALLTRSSTALTAPSEMSMPRMSDMRLTATLRLRW